MNSDNPFRAPSAVVGDVPDSAESELAGKGHRFGAAMVDSSLQGALFLPAAYALGLLRAGTSVMQSVWLGLLGYIVFVLMQSYMLNKSGQTLGKKIVGIRIVDQDSNTPPSLSVLLGRRYSLVYFFHALPFVGRILSLADVLFIFRQDRRCLHDFAANTRVVLHGATRSSVAWVGISLGLMVVLGAIYALLFMALSGDAIVR